VAAVCSAPPITDSFAPDALRGESLAARHAQFQRLYAKLRDEMGAPSKDKPLRSCDQRGGWLSPPFGDPEE
jgi:hypothetical protein